MGMFDWVDFETECPNCGNLVDGFQSKDGPCELGTISPFSVDYFYSRCELCCKRLTVGPSATARLLREKALNKIREELGDNYFEIDVRD